MPTLLSKPERKLRLAVVIQAIEDVEGTSYVKDKRELARIRANALEWIRSRSRRNPFDFAAICDAFQLNEARAREHLLRRLEVNG